MSSNGLASYKGLLNRNNSRDGGSYEKHKGVTDTPSNGRLGGHDSKDNGYSAAKKVHDEKVSSSFKKKESRNDNAIVLKKSPTRLSEGGKRPAQLARFGLSDNIQTGRITSHRRTNTIGDKIENIKERDNSSKSARGGGTDHKSSKSGSLALDLNKIKGREQNGITTKARPSTGLNSDRFEVQSKREMQFIPYENRRGEPQTDRIRTDTTFNMPIGTVDKSKSPHILRNNSTSTESGHTISKENLRKDSKVSSKSFEDAPRNSARLDKIEEDPSNNHGNGDEEFKRSSPQGNRIEVPTKRVLRTLESK